MKEETDSEHFDAIADQFLGQNLFIGLKLDILHRFRFLPPLVKRNGLSTMEEEIESECFERISNRLTTQNWFIVRK